MTIKEAWKQSSYQGNLPTGWQKYLIYSNGRGLFTLNWYGKILYWKIRINHFYKLWRKHG